MKDFELECKQCILLPTCKSKEIIKCDYLWNEINKVSNLIIPNEYRHFVLDFIKLFFPRSKEIYKYTKTEGPDLVYAWREKHGGKTR